MVIGLFETGIISTAGGLFESDVGHLSAEGMGTRLADAMRRGALARPDGEVDKNFLAIDWFEYADLPVDEVRQRFRIPEKGDKAVAAGSVGPWHPEGISEFQRAAGDPPTRLASDDDRRGCPSMHLSHPAPRSPTAGCSARVDRDAILARRRGHRACR